ncbi:hypothetical protein GQ53DRAFT_760297 [Thozetella sp. PMI_491]|nr:hypothetical protein GQ53DRAFT_760297 [Thozetella sp. PMI_491]
MTKRWDEHRPVLLMLYKEQNRPLNEVMVIMEEQYNFKASSRLKRWGVFKYNVGRRNSILTQKTSSPEHPGYAGHRNSPPLSPEARPLDSPGLAAQASFFGQSMFGPTGSPDGDNSTVTAKTEPVTPPSPLSYYERSTVSGARPIVTLPPPVDLRKAPEPFPMGMYGHAQRHQNTGFVSQGPSEGSMYSWADMSSYGPPGP